MSVERNLETSKRYHLHRVDDMDEILTQDFKGEMGGSDFSWTLESHKKSWSQNTAVDTIHEQFGDGDKVCTRFTRTGNLKGLDLEVDMLHIKTFRDGKIAHIWEYWNREQVEAQRKGET